MINSVSLDNQSISASIISAQKNLNNRLDKVNGLLQGFTSDLISINDTIQNFSADLKVITNQVSDIVDGTINVVECNQSYDSRWKLKLPQEMVDKIVDTLEGVKGTLESVEFGDISESCSSIFNLTCMAGFIPTSSGEPICQGYSSEDPGVEGLICYGSHCASGFSSGGSGICNADFCSNNFEDADSGFICPSNHCGDYDSSFTYDDTGEQCQSNYTNTKGDVCESVYSTQGGDEGCMSGFISSDGKQCSSDYIGKEGSTVCDGYSVPGGESCFSNYETSGEGTTCFSFATVDGETCNSYNVDSDGKVDCTNNYGKGDDKCAALYGFDSNGVESCLTTFSSDEGECTGYSNDRSDGSHTCVSNYEVGGQSCLSGYRNDGNTIICGAGVDSGSCTSNVGESTCDFTPGCPQCYGSNHHQDCPQMGCWDIQIPD